ncbi:OmpA/MotB family protein [Desulfovibrio ferrophilus]|uniref:OmpA/MotB domain protein n=1 Tax=Desulfovibrio ferrophilus TaxID=241368 RepID=A0A2Z6B1N9_9BACT|nr:flagellar motor protein MotB [Desulfovibrio ferrophilus]BBD09404.1 OmpA/MotB domain protein [Desulfovibrio ferrophilus]
MGARKEKVKEPEGQPAWLVTFSDMMTLMLTFFVLLVSMSVMDERRKLVVIGSIIGTFGVGKNSFEVLSQKDRKLTVEPGPMELDSINDLEPLKEMIWEDVDEDLNFASNKFVQVFSIPDDVLFEPGGYEISPGGRQILEAALPVFLQVQVPLLLAGHTSSLRDEEGTAFRVEDMKDTMDSSWRLSFHRVMKVYKLLVDAGMDPGLLRVEAFGRFHPRYGALTAKNRRRNRRVDIILDKRNAQWIDRLGMLRQREKDEDFKYKDFIFRFEDREKPQGQ